MQYILAIAAFLAVVDLLLSVYYWTKGELSIFTVLGAIGTAAVVVKVASLP